MGASYNLSSEIDTFCRNAHNLYCKDNNCVLFTKGCWKKANLLMLLMVTFSILSYRFVNEVFSPKTLKCSDTYIERNRTYQLIILFYFTF